MPGPTACCCTTAECPIEIPLEDLHVTLTWYEHALSATCGPEEWTRLLTAESEPCTDCVQPQTQRVVLKYYPSITGLFDAPPGGLALRPPVADGDPVWLSDCVTFPRSEPWGAATTSVGQLPNYDYVNCTPEHINCRNPLAAYDPKAEILFGEYAPNTSPPLHWTTRLDLSHVEIAAWRFLFSCVGTVPTLIGYAYAASPHPDATCDATGIRVPLDVRAATSADVATCLAADWPIGRVHQWQILGPYDGMTSLRSTAIGDWPLPRGLSIGESFFDQFQPWVTEICCNASYCVAGACNIGWINLHRGSIASPQSCILESWDYLAAHAFCSPYCTSSYSDEFTIEGITPTVNEGSPFVPWFTQIEVAVCPPEYQVCFSSLSCCGDRTRNDFVFYPSTDGSCTGTPSGYSGSTGDCVTIPAGTYDVRITPTEPLDEYDSPILCDRCITVQIDVTNCVDASAGLAYDLTTTPNRLTFALEVRRRCGTNWELAPAGTTATLTLDEGYVFDDPEDPEGPKINSQTKDTENGLVDFDVDACDVPCGSAWSLVVHPPPEMLCYDCLAVTGFLKCKVAQLDAIAYLDFRPECCACEFCAAGMPVAPRLTDTDTPIEGIELAGCHACPDGSLYWTGTATKACDLVGSDALGCSSLAPGNATLLYLLRATLAGTTITWDLYKVAKLCSDGTNCYPVAGTPTLADHCTPPASLALAIWHGQGTSTCGTDPRLQLIRTYTTTPSYLLSCTGGLVGLTGGGEWVLDVNADLESAEC